MDREHTQIGGMTFTLEKIIPFEVWVRKNYKSYDAFMSLKESDRETIFLRWKWGLGEESNISLEVSERHTLHVLKDTDFNKLSEALKFYFEKKIAFNDYCKQVRQQIGLVPIRIEDLPAEARAAMSIFEGRPC